MATSGKFSRSSIFALIFLLLFNDGSPSNSMEGYDRRPTESSSSKYSLGAIVDISTRVGKEENIAIKTAIDDFYERSDVPRPDIHIKDSNGDPSEVVGAATDLIKKCHVRAIIGPETWLEAAAIAELGNKAKVPILSLAEELPEWTSSLWPFLMKAARSEYWQMKAVAAVIRTWQWKRVNVIYEDSTSYTRGVVPYLISALEELDAEINVLSPLRPLPPYNYRPDLERLRAGQTRVFVVHASTKVATAMFRGAKSLGMMDNGSVWITTNDVANYIHTLDSRSIDSMQGVIGVKSYFSRNGKKFNRFRSSFRSAFRKKYPHERNSEPGISALQAYDAAWAVAVAMDSFTANMSTVAGQDLLAKLSNISYRGLTGQISFKEGRLAPAWIFQIVNVAGKSYNEVGYWVNGLGFTRSLGKNISYSESMTVLGQIYWPGGPWSIPRGWAIPTISKRLQIGVPIDNAHKEFVYARNESSDGNFTVTGFSIDVFKAALKNLPYDFPHDFVPFRGSYDELVHQIKLSRFDAVVADTAIVANRCIDAEFSQPYAESGLQIVVYVKPGKFGRAWLFKKPFTSHMWALTGIVNVYNGFVVWLIERRHNQAFRGNIMNQIGTMLSLAFMTLFSNSQHGDRLHSNLSRMAMIVWLFTALVITNSFTASLASFLTTQNLNKAEVTIESLIRSGAKVGCDTNSFVVKYLEVIGFHHENIVKVDSEEDYPDKLKSGVIAAAFLEAPYVKVFLARYCDDFTTSKETLKVGGFGYVFPRSSPYIPDISEAVLKVAESGTLLKLESSMIAEYKCKPPNSGEGELSLGIGSFWGLFVVTGGTSTFSLVLFLFSGAHDNWFRNLNIEQQHHNPEDDQRVLFAGDIEYMAPHH